MNNRRHAPIGLEELWRTKWWPNRQFTFLLSVAEVNCVQARARARNKVAEATVTFRRQLAMQMLKNRIGVVAAPSPPRVQTRTLTNHVHRKRKKMRGLGTTQHANSLSGRRNTSAIHVPNAVKLHETIANVTLDMPSARCALESILGSRTVSILA